MLRKPEEQSAATAEENKPIVLFNIWQFPKHGVLVFTNPMKSVRVIIRETSSFQKCSILPDGIET